MNDVIEHIRISQLDVKDSFFSSLIEDYEGFEGWFEKKSYQGEKAYVLRENGVQGFLYLKEEDESDYDITPKFEKKRRLKIGTFKINPHGTVLGERFIGIILKRMLEENYFECYVTVFEKQAKLIEIFEKYGFWLWGKKKNGELVYVKTLEKKNNIFTDFPCIQLEGNNKFVLSIYPKYHTRLFPFSKLETERNHKIEDLSFTNTIEKVYLAGMTGMEKIQSGDMLVIYRTAEWGKSARWNSVATSICTVVERKHISEFNNIEEFIKYCGKGTIFNGLELEELWQFKKYPHIIKMLYNISLPKRVVRNELIEKGVIRSTDYAGFIPLTSSQFEKILELGEVNESFIID
ncbi:hypothetical protein BTT_40150 [Bacillus thuringiensis serovar morrisoni str. 4AA1]|uniref:hypothetical protein n=1 Tax=Bacillus TaxID=1386 RepID=UPI000AB8CA3D|nr:MULTISPECIES: hypothetical protein [Bacillus]MED3101486.1 hypothetical protein [Bacillus thuringiensis]UHO41819.1 hypothetical protein K7H03_18725 [Bacillus thuringiensis]UOC02816.1 hypothetical protein BTT_40150 [Bacillus thuringiensis serovar morrisoni str. 4AA1]WMR05173.1 hypothetical protein RCI28_19290 [Bacillus thuringiensis serovar tenebrionis]WMR14314.1 hypothetical protein RCI27_07175 [Bacillus thuringiensis serovar tenebrionis]